MRSLAQVSARMVQVSAVFGAGQYTDGAGQCGLWCRSVRSLVQVSARMVQVGAVSGEVSTRMVQVSARMAQVSAVSGAGGRGGWRKSVLG